MSGETSSLTTMRGRPDQQHPDAVRNECSSPGVSLGRQKLSALSTRSLCWGAVLLTLSTPACDSPEKASGDATPAPNGSVTTEPTAGCTAALKTDAALINVHYYQNAIRDLLGVDDPPALSTTGLDPDLLLSAGADRMSVALAFELRENARSMSGTVVEQARAGGCTDPGCTFAFVSELAERAFRHPLSGDEATSLRRVFDQGLGTELDVAGAAELAAEAILQAPSFLYLTELGTPSSAADGRRVLTDHEVMARLGALFLESVPDAGLRATAASGGLSTPAGIAAEVERLLAEPRVQAHVTDMLLRWLATGKVRTSHKQDPAFTAELRESMIEETRRFVNSVLWSGSNSVVELLTATHSFVNARTAPLYGLDAAGFGLELVDTPLPAGERIGLLTQPSLLARLADVSATSTVQRGLFVASSLLCRAIPAPPPDVAAASQAELDALETERERALFRLGLPTCQGCHQQFEPLGVLFENYDELGRYRTSAAGHPIDASWDLLGDDSFAGPTLNVVAFSARLADSPELSSCLTRQFSGFAIGRQLTTEETCAIEPIAAAFAQSGGQINALLRAIAGSSFLRIREVAP